MDGDSGNDTGIPRWVKLLATLAIVVVLLLVILHLTGNAPGGHAP